jgi:hypothetical protein
MMHAQSFYQVERPMPCVCQTYVEADHPDHPSEERKPSKAILFRQYDYASGMPHASIHVRSRILHYTLRYTLHGRCVKESLL